MISAVLSVLALLAFAISVVAFTVYRNPSALRDRRRARDGGRRGKPLPDPFEEKQEARSALVTAFIALGAAVFLAYLAYVFG